jgi:hypothetical protein
MTGVENWSNVTKIITPEIGKTIKWKVYENNIDGNWNVSNEFSYVTST